MALDLTILAADGTPGEYVGIDVKAHHALIEAAKACDARLVLRLEDYYGDAAYAPAELPALVAELEVIARASAHETTLLATIERAKQLISRAYGMGRGISAFAD